MSTVLDMIRYNVPLSQWQSFTLNGRQPHGFFDERKIEKTAQSIYNSLSHENAVVIVAREFEQFPATLRLLIRDLCNNGNASGNVRKGVQKLDRLLNGKLLREEKHQQTMNIRSEGASAQYKAKNVRPEVAGATRKYGIVK